MLRFFRPSGIVHPPSSGQCKSPFTIPVIKFVLLNCCDKPSPDSQFRAVSFHARKVEILQMHATKLDMDDGPEL